jgi:acylphosphatase
MNVRWHVYFSGRVQGVGFRYTCVQQARHFAVAGWVKNLENGSVEMIVEGEATELGGYLQSVAESTHGSVADMQKTKSAATGEFSVMSVVH